MNGSLHRSRRHRMIAGVAGGLAESFGVSPWIVRLVFIASALAGVLPAVLVYLALWVVMPSERVSTRR